MRIGDEVYIHGFIDEIRKDTIIIKNDGGYFGTIGKEIVEVEQHVKNDDEYVEAVVKVIIPKWKLGEKVSVYFTDTMCTKGTAEELKDILKKKYQ